MGTLDDDLDALGQEVGSTLDAKDVLVIEDMRAAGEPLEALTSLLRAAAAQGHDLSPRLHDSIRSTLERSTARHRDDALQTLERVSRHTTA